MSTLLEAKAIISAEDKTGPAFAAVEARIAGLSRQAAAVGDVSAAVGRASAAVQQQGRAFAQTTQAVSRYSGAVQAAVSAAPLAAAIPLAHGARHLAAAVQHTYREFDDLRRYQKAILGLSDAQQKPLLDQAFHLGGSTRFNDLQVLHAQLDLAQRGIKADAIVPITDAAAHFAQALGTDLPTAAKTLEGILFSTGKSLHDGPEAIRAAEKAASFATKLAKIGGLDEEDVRQFFKYGGSSGSVAGLSDETLGGIAAVLRRSNIRGDEAGVFTRALSGKLVAPTRQGLAALAAMGVDYNQFTKLPGGLSAEGFETAFQQRFGRRLSGAVRDKLSGVLGDGETVSDRSKFTTAVTDLLSSEFAKNKHGKLAAKDAQALAKMVGEFHKLSVESVDSEGLLRAILKASPTLAQLNAFLGEKQGGRGAILAKNAATFDENVGKLRGAGEHFHRDISAQRMEGYSGAVSRFEGAIKNFETAVGRAFDRPLTEGYNVAARTLQGITDLGDNALRAAGAVGGLLTAFATAEAALLALAVGQNLAGNAAGAASLLGLGGGTAARFAVARNLGVAGLGAYFGYEAINAIGGKVAELSPGRAYVPKTSEDVAEMRQRLSEIEADIAGRKARVHPTMRDNIAPDIARLEGEGERLRARLRTAGVAVAGDIPPLARPSLAGAVDVPGGLKATVEGPITAELKGQGDVNVTVRVEAGSTLLNAVTAAQSATSSGNIRTNLGISHAEAAPERHGRGDL